MNLMVKYMLLVLQVYAISSSAVLQGFAASTNFEPASGPKGNKPLEPSSSPKTLPNDAAPIVSTPVRSTPSPSVIPPTVPVSVPPIPLAEKGPTIGSPLSPPTVPVQIAPPPKETPQSPPPSIEEPQSPPPSKEEPQSPPPSIEEPQSPPPSIEEPQSPPPSIEEPQSPPPSIEEPQSPPPSIEEPQSPPPSIEEPQSPPPSIEEPQSPPPMAQAAPPSMSQVPPSMPQSPPSILPEPVVSPPTNLPMASPPTSPTLPAPPPFNLPLPADIPPSTLPSSPPMPPTNLPMAPPPTSPTLPVSPPNFPLPAGIPPTTLPSSPPMPPTNLPMAPPPTSPALPSSPPNLPPPAELSPSTLPSSPPMPPTNLPMPPPPTSPALPVPPPNLPPPVELPPSTLPSSPPMPPMILVPPSNLSAPVASPPSTLPANPPPNPSTLTVPPPNLPAPVPSPPSTFPRDSPPSPPTVTMPLPNLPGPVASPPQESQKSTPPPNPTFAEPPSDRPVPVALPPVNSPKNLQPIHRNSSVPPTNLPEPHVSPISPISTPIPPSPKNQTNNIAPSQRSRVKAPFVHNGPSSSDHAPPPYSSSKSPPTKSHPPPSLPPFYPPPPPGPERKPVHHNPPPTLGPESKPRHPASPPSPGPKSKPVHHNPPPPLGPESKPRHPASPPSPGKATPVENSVSPSVSPSVQTTMPVLPPKVSPSRSSPKIPKPLQALPPPPPNEDCLSMTCKEPLTTTPPGTPCKCVLPMQVELGLGASLYTFFPLVSELATEMAAGLFMRSSQVRIMGANEDNQDSVKTLVIIDLVPLGEKFDNYTAYIIAQKLWQKQVPIKTSLFGDYEVLYVKYPGLPPSPPMPSSRNGMTGEPYGHGNNGRDVKPVGVNLGKQRRSNRLSGGVIAIIALSAVVAVILVSVAVWVLLVKSRDRSRPGQTPTTTLPSVTKSSGIGGSMTGSGPESASLSFRSTIAYNGSANTFSLSDMEKATDNFSESGVLGEGGFGRVYSGLLEDGTKVAVKVLKRADQQGGREFLAEVEMLSRLHHRNLVRLLGICTEERNRCLVYELVPNGSVESHLHGTDKEIAPLDWAARLKIALGAARGLAYLHEDSSPRVIHRDFKSSNILLEHDFTPKVSDFGLARSALDEENQHISTRVMGTFGYVAPEYAMTGHLLVKSDVYSYGVVLLELLSGRKPVDMSMPSGQENLVAWARPLLPTPEGLSLLIDPSLSPDVPFDSISKVAAIASMCVQPEVSHRPFMGEVVQALKLVCNECEETRDLGSRTCSQEDLASMDFDPRDSTNSGPPPGPSRSTYPSYESPLDVESGFPGHGLDVDSFRLTSSSGPLRPRRRLQIWERMKMFSSGSMSDYGEVLRLLSRSR